MIKRAQCEIIRLRKHLTKTKQKRDDVLIKRNEVLINRDNINAKREKVIDLFNETMTNEINKKKKKSINFEIVTTTKKKK